MACNVRFVLSLHPADAVKLVLLSDREEGIDDDLVLVASRDAGCAVSFGYSVPDHSPGLAGLLMHKPETLAVQIGSEGNSAPVIFPNASANWNRPFAELLDSIRFRLGDRERVTVILDVEALARDLPPMYAEDQLLAFWEVRDILLERHIEAFQFLADRLENEAPEFLGFFLYTRHHGNVEDLELRAQQIRHCTRLFSDEPLIVID